LSTKTATTSEEGLAQTTFYFDPSEYREFLRKDLVSDPGGYEPSREDDMFAPFYTDASQRLLVIGRMDSLGPLVMKTEVLLRLARERKGEDLRWGEWKANATRVSCDRGVHQLWVCGPRVLCVYWNDSGQTLMDMHDFSAQASPKYTKSAEDGMAERFKPNITQTLPWEMADIIVSYGSHDSITFVLVKTPATQTRLETHMFCASILKII
jgi:hypothetical protein